MGINKRKIQTYTLIIILLLVISFAYREFATKKYLTDDQLPDYAKDRKIVTVWMKQSYYTDKINEFVTNYNIKNRDNIYVDMHVEGYDYYNILRLLIQTEKNPDIFQLGYYDLVRKDKVVNLNDVKFDFSSISQNNIYKYKGQPMGVKIGGNNVKFVCNKKILTDCGLNPDQIKTWDDVIKYSEVIKRKFPDIVPFEFPGANFYNYKVSVGETSVNRGPVYTSFWNHKTGKYDFSYSKDILKIFNKMYTESIIPKDFDKKDSKAVRDDFSNGKTAMILSTYEDKVYFLSSIPLQFDISINDIPKIDIKDTENYYLTDDINVLVVDKVSVDKPEVFKIYKMILNVCEDNSKVNIYKYKESYFPEYSKYDDVSKFKFEEKDPTSTLGFSTAKILDFYRDAITGNTSVEDAIKGLNEYLDNYCKETKKIDSNYFDNYVDKE